MAKRGRPTKFRPEFIEAAAAMCADGAIDIELAQAFSVNISTITRWATAHPEFRAALKVAKKPADERVERSLYSRAMGYSFEAVKIFMPAGADKPVYAPYIEHVPPDPTSMIFWLKNRKPEAWRDKQEVDHTGNLTLEALVLKAREKMPKPE